MKFVHLYFPSVFVKKNVSTLSTVFHCRVRRQQETIYTPFGAPTGRVASRKVRSFGTPGNELGCIEQQCLNGFWIQIRPGNRPVLGILHKIGRHQSEVGVGIGYLLSHK